MSKIVLNGQEIPIGGNGRNFITDETLTMSPENVLGVTTPVKSVSKDDFNKMSDEEKKGLVVVMNEEASGGENGEIYSTEETRIGTWVDGKPLYRVSGEGMTGTIIDSWYTIVKPIPYDVEIKFISVVIKNTLGQYASIAFESPASARIAYNYTDTDGIRFLNTDNIFNERPFAYKIEYTKTTD